MFDSGYEVAKVTKLDGVRELGGLLHPRAAVRIICSRTIGKPIVPLRLSSIHAMTRCIARSGSQPDYTTFEHINNCSIFVWRREMIERGDATASPSCRGLKTSPWRLRIAVLACRMLAAYNSGKVKQIVSELCLLTFQRWKAPFPRGLKSRSPPCISSPFPT